MAVDLRTYVRLLLCSTWWRDFVEARGTPEGPKLIAVVDMCISAVHWYNTLLVLALVVDMYTW